MSYFFSTPVDIDIVLDEPDDRTMVDVKLDKNRREKAPLYMDGESVKGAVTVRPKDGKRLEHTGIKVQFIGTIGTQLDHYDQQQSSIFRRRRSSSSSYYYSSSSTSSSFVSGALGLLTPQWTLPSIRLGLQQRQQVTDGLVEMFFDRGNHYEFLSLNQELAAPGELQHPQTFDFNFKNVEKQYESYNGINVKLRYFVRVTVSRRMADVIREKDIWVYSYRIPPEMNSSIKMDVGIEDCLHIEFEYSKSKYHLKDVIVGRIYFLLVRLKIKHMELSIIRRETTGAAPNQYNESETLVRFEIMDGSPSRGETIPIRLFLGGFDLTPTFRDVNKKFSTRYYLSLVLIDEGKLLTPPPPPPSSLNARRYFKQSEIILYRQAPDAPAIQGAGIQSLPPPPENKVAPATVQA
ncbi:vacuolar protein sorting-associated protein 26B [Trichoderma asperellum]|uniref:Vacuolar protein sorting-associated protein 26B n=1 Tax=Trichoderma asperellum TaxID=101201 RepID=A0A6V8QVG6_TRIAP|nr:vacuolar protein sorting-associated protein 26B [Trichoderma asperellum]